ncbi:protein of unknown function [Magnetospirillum sp. XM-1]|nr:protein of unknown function [Magnetospirillum sp. XM-1]
MLVDHILRGGLGDFCNSTNGLLLKLSVCLAVITLFGLNPKLDDFGGLLSWNVILTKPFKNQTVISVVRTLLTTCLWVAKCQSNNLLLQFLIISQILKLVLEVFNESLTFWLNVFKQAVCTPNKLIPATVDRKRISFVLLLKVRDFAFKRNGVCG